MRKIWIFICAVILLAIVGCNHQSMSNRLADIDTLIAKEQFDSACVLLKEVAEASMTEEDQAHYGLLATQLGYITNNPLQSDSLLDMAFTYYYNKGNSQKLADAYYYKSRRLEMNSNYSQAILYGKEAERLAINTDNAHLQFKITESMAYLNGLCENYLLQLRYAKKALFLAQKVQNKNWTAYSYSNICFAFANLNQNDSVLYYIEKARPYINNVDDSDRAEFLTYMGILFKRRNPRKAKEYFENAIECNELPITLEHLADIYFAEGNKEKAYSFWKKALVSSGGVGYEKDNLIHSIISYDLERGKLDEASANLDRVIAIKDSIITVLRNDTIKDLQMRFDHEVAVHKADKKLIRWQWYLGAAAFIGLVLIGIWLRKRHKMTATLNKREIEMQQLILQVDDKKNEIQKYENQIAQLKAEQQKNSRTLAEQESKIEEMARQKEDAQKDIQMLSDKMKEWTGAEVEKLRQGALLMADVQENKSVRHWSVEKQDALIAYYCAIHTDMVKRINKSPKKLSNKQILYLILVDMGKSLEDMSKIMGIEKDSLRSYKYQINKKEKNT